ncbi:MAG: Bax inhibitor-1/YccA family protein [Candidatus Competibacteraceae bacterium]
MLEKEQYISRPVPSELSTNKVLRNTYTLLSMTLLFSALMAGVAIAVNAQPMHWLFTLAGYFGLLFLTSSLRNSAWGIAAVFALTGFMGYTLGPIINLYLGLPNGPQVVMTALAGTGIIFLSLSGYALVTRKDFSFMGAFLMVGILVAFLAGVRAMVFSLPGYPSRLSDVRLVDVRFDSVPDQRDHSRRETNYIMATVTLYVSIYNLFLSLLQLLMAFSGRRLSYPELAPKAP